METIFWIRIKFRISISKILLHFYNRVFCARRHHRTIQTVLRRIFPPFHRRWTSIDRTVARDTLPCNVIGYAQLQAFLWPLLPIGPLNFGLPFFRSHLSIPPYLFLSLCPLSAYVLHSSDPFSNCTFSLAQIVSYVDTLIFCQILSKASACASVNQGWTLSK